MGDIYFLDMEYSCNQGEKFGSIISIGLISLDGKREVNQLIRPGKKVTISDWCTKITGLRREDLLDCPRLEEAYKDIFKGIDRDDIIYAWGNDGKVLMGTAKSRGIDLNLNIVNYQRKMREKCGLYWDPGLRNTMTILDLEDEYNHHDALEDSKMLRDIYIYFEVKNGQNRKIAKMRKAEYLHRLNQLMKEYSDVSGVI